MPEDDGSRDPTAAAGAVPLSRDPVMDRLLELWQGREEPNQIARRLRDPADRHPWLEAARWFQETEAARRGMLRFLAAARWRRRLLVVDPHPGVGLAARYWRAHGFVAVSPAPSLESWVPLAGDRWDAILIPSASFVPAPLVAGWAGALPELGVVLASDPGPEPGEWGRLAGLVPGETVAEGVVAYRRLRPVHVVVPVYGAVDYLQDSLAALTATTQHYPVSVTVIDDATPDPEQAARIAALAVQVPGARFLRHADNQGFAATANEGMRLAPAGSDVVLLNSDAVVTPHWLGKLAEAAWSRPGVATVTPLSNWAGDLSIPCAPSLAETCTTFLEHRADDVHPHYPEVPTGVGFCLYIRAEALARVGLLDPAFGVGYGEEVDFCRRAVARGFVNVLDDRTFVYHYGHRSMDEHGVVRDLGMGTTAAEQELARRHPDLRTAVDRFLSAGFMAAIRAEWVSQLGPYRPKRRPRVWIQLWRSPHHEAGGIERSTRALVEMLSPLYECLVSWTDDTRVYLEEPRASLSERNLARSSWPLTGVEWDGGRLTPTPTLVGDWADVLVRYRIDVVYVVHSLGAGPTVMQAARRVGLPTMLAVHDYALLCPDYTLLGPRGVHCGVPDRVSTCRTCLANKTALWAERPPLDVDLERWRRGSAEMVRAADRVIYPSPSAQAETERVLGPGPAHVIRPVAAARGLTPATPPTPERVVVVLGYRGPHKGSDLLVRLVPLLVGAHFSVHFVGTAGRQWPELENLPQVSFSGPYRGRDVVRRLLAARAFTTLLPSAFAETWSLTLSESWLAGVPAVVSPFGAPAARVRAQGGGVVASSYTVAAFMEAVQAVWDRHGRYQEEAIAAGRALPSALVYGAAHAHLVGQLLAAEERR